MLRADYGWFSIMQSTFSPGLLSAVCNLYFNADSGADLVMECLSDRQGVSKWYQQYNATLKLHFNSKYPGDMQVFHLPSDFFLIGSLISSLIFGTTGQVWNVFATIRYWNVGS